MDANLIPIRHIAPPHEVRDAEKLDRLTAAMNANGWAGRPLLVLRTADCFQAITGSHRIVAAERAGLDEAPCVEINATAFCGAGYEPNDLWDDEVTLSILREIGDETSESLMAEEIAANEREGLTGDVD